MVSRQVEKRGSVPVRAWLGLAAGAVFVGLLAALMHVLHGQVEQAQLRQMQQSALQTALSDCTANQSGAARVQCIAQLDVAQTPNVIQPAYVELHPGGKPRVPGLFAGQSPNGEPPGLAPGGLTETAFVR